MIAAVWKWWSANNNDNDINVDHNDDDHNDDNSEADCMVMGNNSTWAVTGHCSWVTLSQSGTKY